MYGLKIVLCHSLNRDCVLKKSNKHLVIVLKVGSHAFSDYICPHFELKLPLFFQGM